MATPEPDYIPSNHPKTDPNFHRQNQPKPLPTQSPGENAPDIAPSPPRGIANTTHPEKPHPQAHNQQPTASTPARTHPSANHPKFQNQKFEMDAGGVARARSAPCHNKAPPPPSWRRHGLRLKAWSEAVPAAPCPATPGSAVNRPAIAERINVTPATCRGGGMAGSALPQTRRIGGRTRNRWRAGWSGTRCSRWVVALP